MYIAEISPAKFRGALGSGNQLAVTLGILLAYCLGPLLDSWRWLAIAGAVPPVLMVVLMVSMPETPRWLIKNDRISEALRVLRRLRGGSNEENQEECRDIQSTLGKFSLVQNSTVFVKVKY